MSTPAADLAGEPRDDIRLTDVPAAAIVTVDRRYSDVAEEVLAAGALARSIQIAAAVRQVLDMTARYCTERVQFGTGAAPEMVRGGAHAARLRARQRGAPVVGGGFDEPERPHLQHGQARA